MTGTNNLPAVGDVVEVCTENRTKVRGIVCAVHGKGYEIDGVLMQPSINVFYASPDAEKSDSYGRQVDRLSSLSHFASGPSKMDNPGRYWQFAK